MFKCAWFDLHVLCIVRTSPEWTTETHNLHLITEEYYKYLLSKVYPSGCDVNKMCTDLFEEAARQTFIMRIQCTLYMYYTAFTQPHSSTLLLSAFA